MGSEPKPEPVGLSEAPTGVRVLIDANIFIYHFTGVSPECTQFLERCERGEVLGITGVHLLLEVLHRLMMIEAVVEGLVSPAHFPTLCSSRLGVNLSLPARTVALGVATSCPADRDHRNRALE